MHINKLRIGVLLENYKKEEGGAHSYYNTLVEGIANYKFDENLEFVFVCMDGYLDKSAPQNSICFDIVRIMKKKYSLFSLLIKLLNLKGISYLPLAHKIRKSYTKRFNNEIKLKLIENEIDLFYTLTPFYKDLDYPTVTTHWDIGHKSAYAFPEMNIDGEYEFRESFYRKYLQKAFAVICESETGKKELCYYKEVNPNRVFVVPIFPGNMINLNIPQENEKDILNKFDLVSKQFFFYPAQFWAHKNHYNLVLAFESFHKKYPDVKLLLSGSNKGNFEYIQEIVSKLSLDKQVVFAGFISNEEMNVFYKNAISLVMPTMLGPTNMPPLEAQALGCKVICTDIPGHREILNNDGLFINPAKRDEIFQAMEKYYLEKDCETKNVPVQGKKTLESSLAMINDIFTELAPIRKTFR